jgi:hypothetical protein
VEVSFEFARLLGLAGYPLTNKHYSANGVLAFSRDIPYFACKKGIFNELLALLLLEERNDWKANF